MRSIYGDTGRAGDARRSKTGGVLDLRLRGANVVTMDHARPEAREIGVWRGRIVGVDGEVSGLPAREEVDLRGATVLPAFVDAHVHLAWTGLRSRAADVTPCRRVDDVLAVIAAAAAKAEPGAWVDVAGYDQRPLGRHLRAAELDAVAGGRRVFVVHDSGHACVVSSNVLATLPAGVPHDDGVLVEGGMAAASALRQPYALGELVPALRVAAEACLAEGVTACAEAGIGPGGLISHSPIELAAYQRAELPIRVQLMVAGGLLREMGAHPADDVPRAMDLGLGTGFGGDRLSIGALKIFTDGGMMARTAALTSPYVGTDNTGQLQTDPAELRAVIIDGHRAGWQLAIHAIGDRAVDLTLDALAEAQRLKPRPGARHRVEHAGLVRPDQLARFAATGAVADIQPNFLFYLGEDYAQILGPERAPWLYRARSFLDAGIPLVASSDRPVTEGAPLRGIQTLVTRTIGPEERLTVEEALRAYTSSAAHACGWEGALGAIAPGHHADLVVLGPDPRRVDPHTIADIPILATLVGGRVKHGALP